MFPVRKLRVLFQLFAEISIIQALSQSAALLVFEPRFQVMMAKNAFAFRRRNSAKQKSFISLFIVYTTSRATLVAVFMRFECAHYASRWTRQSKTLTCWSALSACTLKSCAKQPKSSFQFFQSCWS